MPPRAMIAVLRIAAPRIALATAALALSGCGAGVITGVVVGRGGGSSPAPAPSIVLALDSGPLAIGIGETYLRRATLQNVAVPPGAVSVRLVAPTPAGDVSSEQRSPLLIRSGSGAVVTFAMNTAEIAAAVGDPTATDVDARLVIGVLGEQGFTELVAAPFRLWRKPVARLVPSGGQRTVVSALGGRLRLRVSSLPTANAGDVTVEIGSLDPSGATPGLLRAASDLSFTAVGGGVTEIECIAPPWSFPTAATVRVAHTLAGRSDPFDGVYYRPELVSAVARRGVTDGGDVISLQGHALVPYRFAAGAPAQLDFSALEVRFEKSGLRQVVSEPGLRPSLSSQSNVVLVTPPSPDGRPGPATLELAVVLGGVEIVADAPRLFSYGADDPTFMPRGTSLRGALSAIAWGPLRRPDGGPGTPADAAMVFKDAVDVPFAQVYESQENGMLFRTGPPLRAAVRGNLAQRLPSAAAVADFDGDRAGDLLVVNLGSGTGEHTLLRGDPQRLGQFAAPVGYIVAPAQSLAEQVTTTELNGDGVADVLIRSRDPLRGVDLSTAARSQAGGHTPLPVSPPGTGEFSASVVADFDGDGHQDVLLAGGRAEPDVQLAHGDGFGGFTDFVQLSLDGIPGLVNSTVIGAFRGGEAASRSIVLLLRDEPSATATRTVVVPPSGRRSYDPLAALVVAHRVLGPTDATQADLDGDGVPELVVAGAAELALYRWVGDRYVELPASVDLTSTTVGQVDDLSVAVAVPLGAGGPPQPAVFLTHSFEVNQGSDQRITTFLVGPGPTLLDPAARHHSPRSIRGVTWGWFSLARPSVAVVYDDETVAAMPADGLGAFDEPAQVLAVGGLLPWTATKLPRDTETLTPALHVFVLADGRVGTVRYDVGLVAFSPRSLFDYLGPAGSGATVERGTAIESADLDADGRRDLIVALVARLASGESRTLVVALRGQPPQSPEPFAFYLPDPQVPQVVLDGRASALAVGNFGPDPASFFEAAVAVPAGAGEEGVHFCHFDAGSVTEPRDHRFVLSPRSGPPLASLRDPVLLASIDLDGDVFDDLLVVSGSLESLYFYRQGIGGDPAGRPDPSTFAISAETAIPPGDPVALRLADFDGDSIRDILVQIESGSSATYFVGGFLTNGFGGVRRSFILPQHSIDETTAYPAAPRHGDQLSIGVGDTNGDGVPDLVLGWSADQAGDQSYLRTLFGGYR